MWEKIQSVLVNNAFEISERTRMPPTGILCRDHWLLTHNSLCSFWANKLAKALQLKMSKFQILLMSVVHSKYQFTNKDYTSSDG